MLAPRAVKRKATATRPTTVAAAESLPPPAEPAPGNDTSEKLQEQDGSRTEAGTSQAVVETSNAGTSGAADLQNGVEAIVKGQERSSSSKVFETTTEELEDSDKLAHIGITVEEAFSDWGLCQNKELCKRLESSKTGYVHISNLLAISAISALTTVMTDITKALRATPSEVVELDDSGFQVKRLQAASFEQLADLTTKDWGERTFYLENIPLATKAKPYTRATLKALLSEILETTIEILRLPQLFSPSSATAGPDQPSTSGDTQFAGLFVKEKATSAKDRKGKQRQEGEDTDATEDGETASERMKRERGYALPSGGGAFKGFAFVVLRDRDKAKEAFERWSWDDRGKRRADVASEADMSDDEEDQEEQEEADVVISEQEEAASAEGAAQDHKAGEVQIEKPVVSPRKRADQSGFRMLSISAFNALKAEYLAYSSDISLLREAHEDSKSASQSHRRRSRSPVARQKQKKSPSPARWERKARSPSPNRWVRKPLSPSPERAPRKYDSTENDYPRGCVVFFKRFNSRTNTRTLKALLQAILEHEEMDVEKLQYVDHVRSVDSCHIRFTDAATASFFASYFSGHGAKKLLHTDNSSTEPSEAFTTAPTGETRTLEAEVMTGTPEIIYWSKVPLKARNAYAQSKKVEMVVDDDEEAYHRSMQAEAAAAASASAKTQEAKKRSASVEVEERNTKREKLEDGMDEQVANSSANDAVVV